MKHIYLFILLCLLSSCYDPITEETGKKAKQDKNCDLLITVFSQTDTPPYPVSIQIYDEEGKQCREQALTADHPQQELSLPYGNYRLVALSGTSYYKLPTHMNLESTITYGDLLPQLPLQMGQADITLSAPSATASLQLDNMTAQIELTAREISSRTKSVKVTLSNLYSALNIGGGFEDPAPISIPLHHNDLLWQAGPYHLLPSLKNNVVVSMEVQLPDTTMFYGYNLPYGLEPGGRYQLSLSTTEGAKIDHTLNLSNDEVVSMKAFPMVPSLWDGHIVVLADKVSADEGYIWLLSCNEWEDIVSANNESDPTEATEIAHRYQEGGNLSGRISQWTIPSRDEANLLRNRYAGTNASTLNDLLASVHCPEWSLTDGSGNNVRYLCNDAQHTFTLANSTSSITKAGTKATYHLRLLKKLRIKIKE